MNEVHVNYTDVERRILMSSFGICCLCEKHIEGHEMGADIVTVKQCGCVQHAQGCGSEIVHRDHEPSTCSPLLQLRVVNNFFVKGSSRTDTGASYFNRRLQESCPNMMAAFKSPLFVDMCLVVSGVLLAILGLYLDPCEKYCRTYGLCDKEDNHLIFLFIFISMALSLIILVTRRTSIWQDLYNLRQSTNVTVKCVSEDLKRVQRERDQLKKENEGLALKCAKALATASQKRAQLDTVTREIASLKEDFKTARTDLPEKFVAEKQKQVPDEPFYAEEEELLLCSAWESFKTKFKIVQDTVTNLLQNSISVRNSSVRATNMALVREMSSLMEGIRNHFLSTTEECTEKLEDVLGLATPLPAKIENEGPDSQLLD